ncbi:MAG: ABC transporter ATP-binding protein [Rhodospirillales bacterium]|nr:ABC transporter ATP-binding protein [Alphaproteobacteria bacterium]MCB1838867.1 ABC transporter ATP-binding protein [Alphaproteobacteria bacterium]MCB9977101.1 ABC transporter ATP-binding protein [Rhodospirillales bacterium]
MSGSGRPLLEVKNLTRVLPLEVPVTLVKDVSLSIDPGQFISITGPSGSGKSSLLYLLGLLDRPTEGEIIIDGLETSKLSGRKLSSIRLGRLGFVFQFHFLLAEFTILDNVMIPMRKLGKWPENEQEGRAVSLLKDLGLGDHLHKVPSQLSGGQRQRVAIARAVSNEPLVILADEPTGNLDTKNSKIVHDIFRDLVDKKKTTVVMVTHDLDLASKTDRRIHLVDGKIASGN